MPFEAYHGERTVAVRAISVFSRPSSFLTPSSNHSTSTNIIINPQNKLLVLPLLNSLSCDETTNPQHKNSELNPGHEKTRCGNRTRRQTKRGRQEKAGAAPARRRVGTTGGQRVLPYHGLHGCESSPRTGGNLFLRFVCFGLLIFLMGSNENDQQCRLLVFTAMQLSWNDNHVCLRLCVLYLYSSCDFI